MLRIDAVHFFAFWLGVMGMALSAMTTHAAVNLLWKNAKQMIVVTTPHWQAIQGTLRLFERHSDEAAWVEVIPSAPIVVGAHGMGWGKGLHRDIDLPIRKREGDLRAPAGVFRLPSAFGYAAHARSKLPYSQATADMRCVDDSASAFYNQMVYESAVKPDWNSAEAMRRADTQYEWGVVVDNNPQRLPGAGSCVFLHVWRNERHPTAGCTAMSPPQMQKILERLDPALSPVLVQLPVAEYAAYQVEWGLPCLGECPIQHRAH